LDEPSEDSRQNVQVLEVTTRELVVGNDLDLALTLLLDNDVVTEVVGAALDLDAVLEELLEGSDVEDLVAGRLRSINDVLLGLLLGLARLLLLKNDFSLLHFCLGDLFS
jgi:hypothetical protein